MIKNYIITALRNFYKYISHVSINVIGLGIGIAMCIISFVLSSFNNEFNNCYDEDITDKIYRIEYSQKENDKDINYGSVNVYITNFIDDEIPGIEDVIRFFGRRTTIKTDKHRFEEYMNFTNEAFLRNFPLNLIKGSFNHFNDPDAIYLNEEMAEKYFGNEDPVGQSLELMVKDTEGGIQQFIVRGVFKKNPLNSSFNYIRFLTNFENIYKIYNVDKFDPDIENMAETFIKVKNTDVLENPKFIAKLNELTHLKNKEVEVKYRFSPFSKTSKSDNNTIRNQYTNSEISKEVLLTFNLLGLMILLIACFNYTIYAFSFAGNRLKEIGVRKVTGGTQKNIIFQFFSESLVISIIACFLGIILSYLALPAFSNIWGGFEYALKDISNTRIVIFLIVVTISMSFVASFYPAIYISKFKPISILGKTLKLKKTGLVTYSLVLLQQVITVVGLGASIIFTENIYWQEDMDLGFDKENLLTIQGLNATDKGDVFVETVKDHPKILNAGISWKMIGNGTGDRKVIMDGEEYYVDLMETGPNYLETHKIKLLEGRFWRNNSEVDMKSTAMVNEKFAELTGVENPIGHLITLPNGNKVEIVGIIKNYKQAGPWEKSEPTVIHYPLAGQFKFLAIRGRSLENLKEVDLYCKEQWEKLEPFMPYVSMFEINTLVGAENTSISFKKTFFYAALIALLLSVGGMFSLVTMLVQKRTKEIAIRKTIGSGFQSILLLISKPYIRISIIAAIIASFAGIYLSKALLDNVYEYHVKVKLIWYLLSGILMLIVTILTISTQTFRAATANPVNSLRNE